VVGRWFVGRGDGCDGPRLLPRAGPIATYARLFDRAFIEPASLSNTMITATPVLLTGLAAAAAFRMRLWNIGERGQLYLGGWAPPALGSSCATSRAW